MSRALACVTALVLLALASPANGQPKDAFLRALVDFANAAAGRYGDEGPALLAALDRMEAAVAEWDAAVAKVRAGMGTEFADYNGDGGLDLIVTNHEFETPSLFRNDGGSFVDATVEAGIGAPTLPFVGFGVAFFDADTGGDLDLSIVNGHGGPCSKSGGPAAPWKRSEPSANQMITATQGRGSPAASRLSPASVPG